MVTCTQNAEASTAKATGGYDGYIEKDDLMIVYRPDQFHTGGPNEYRIVAKSEKEAAGENFKHLTVIQCCTYKHHGSAKTTLAIAVHKEYPLNGIKYLNGEDIEKGACQKTKCTPMMVETMEWRLQVLAGLLKKEFNRQLLDPMDKEQLKLFKSTDLKERFMVASLDGDSRDTKTIFFNLHSLLLHTPLVKSVSDEVNERLVTTSVSVEAYKLHSLLNYWMLKLNSATEKHYTDKGVVVDKEQLVTPKYETRHPVILYRPDMERISGVHHFRRIFSSVKDLGKHLRNDDGSINKEASNKDPQIKIINCGKVTGANTIILVAIDASRDKDNRFNAISLDTCLNERTSVEAWRLMEKRINTLELMRMTLKMKPSFFTADSTRTLIDGDHKVGYSGKNRNGMYAQLWLSKLSSRPHDYLDRFRYGITANDSNDETWTDGYILDMDLKGVFMKDGKEAELKTRVSQIDTEYNRIVDQLNLDEIDESDD